MKLMHVTLLFDLLITTWEVFLPSSIKYVEEDQVDLASRGFTFSSGEETFKDLSLFIATQQQLEGVFDPAFLAAMGQPVLAPIAGQIACIRSD